MPISNALVPVSSALVLCVVISTFSATSQVGDETGAGDLPSNKLHNVHFAGSRNTIPEDMLSGKWIAKESTDQRKTRMQEIERVTKSLGFLVQGKAKERLRKATTPSRDIKIVNGGDQVSIDTSQGRVAAKTDGSTTNVKSSQGSGKVQAVWQQDKLVVTMQASNGTRTTTYQPSKDGRTMTLHIQLTSQSLPEPLRYQVTYVRK